MIKCCDVIKLPSLKQLRLVAGETGLDRNVRWVHMVDLPDVVHWVRGGELLFMNGISLQSPLDLLGIVRDIAAKNLAGLVITPGKYIAAIPPEVLDLADTLEFPLFELPWEVKLVEVFQEVTGYINQYQTNQNSIQDILKNLVFGNIDNIDLLIRRAGYYGYDLNEPCQVMIVRINNLEEYAETRLDSGASSISKATLSNENAGIEIKDHFQQIMLDVVARHYAKPIYLLWLDSIIMFLPVKKHTKQVIENNIRIAAKAIDELSQALPGLVINIGLGNSGTGPLEIRKSLHQAEQALKFGISDGQSSVYTYEQMGLNKLLCAVSQEVLHSFYHDYTAQLQLYDTKHGTNLVGDLEVFLQHNGNFGDAAKSLFIHRNTLIYRMKKVEELTGKPLDDFNNRIGFYIGIMIGKYFL